MKKQTPGLVKRLGPRHSTAEEALRNMEGCFDNILSSAQQQPGLRSFVFVALYDANGGVMTHTACHASMREAIFSAAVLLSKALEQCSKEKVLGEFFLHLNQLVGLEVTAVYGRQDDDERS